MATTVGNFSAIDDTEVDSESPITESLMTRMRDNSYWIDPATTRTTATSNTLVLTPNTTAGTTQWQEIDTIGGLDGTKSTKNGISTSWSTITTKTSGILDFTLINAYNSSPSAHAHVNVKVDLSDDTFVSCSAYNTTTAAGRNVYSGTITTGSNVGFGLVASTTVAVIQMRRNSGNFQVSGSGNTTDQVNWIIL